MAKNVGAPGRGKLPAIRLLLGGTTDLLASGNAWDAEASDQKARSPLNEKRGTVSVGENIAALLKVRVEGKDGGDNSEIHQDSKHDIQTCSRIRVYIESPIENGYD